MNSGNLLWMDCLTHLLNFLSWSAYLYLLLTINLLILHTVLSGVLLFSPDHFFLSVTPPHFEQLHVVVSELEYDDPLIVYVSNDCVLGSKRWPWKVCWIWENRIQGLHKNFLFSGGLWWFNHSSLKEFSRECTWVFEWFVSRRISPQLLFAWVRLRVMLESDIHRIVEAISIGARNRAGRLSTSLENEF